MSTVFHRDVLKEADPVNVTELERVSSHPVFRELLNEIVAVPQAHSAAPRIVPVNASRHDVDARRGVRIAAGALACVVVAAAVLVTFALQGPGVSRPVSRVEPGWRLVSDVTPLASWRVLSSPSYQSGMSMACPSEKTCLIGDVASSPTGSSQIEVTHDAGGTWSRAQLPDSLSLSTSIDCVDGSTCFVAGESSVGNDEVAVTRDGGASWETLPMSLSFSSPSEFSSIACTSADSCVVTVASGGDGAPSSAIATRNGGASWSQFDFATSFVPTQVSCLANGACVAGGNNLAFTSGAILVSGDGGLTWSSATVPSGVGPVDSVWCGARAGVCLASAISQRDMAGQVLSSSDGGHTWSLARGAGMQSTYWTSLGCNTTNVCWGSGMSVNLNDDTEPREAVLASTADLGQTWQSAPLPLSSLAVMLAVQCPSSTACYSLGIQDSSQAIPRILLLGYKS